jgi:hypothetical protein
MRLHALPLVGLLGTYGCFALAPLEPLVVTVDEPRSTAVEPPAEMEPASAPKAALATPQAAEPSPHDPDPPGPKMGFEDDPDPRLFGAFFAPYGDRCFDAHRFTKDREYYFVNACTQADGSVNAQGLRARFSADRTTVTYAVEASSCPDAIPGPYKLDYAFGTGPAAKGAILITHEDGSMVVADRADDPDVPELGAKTATTGFPLTWGCWNGQAMKWSPGEFRSL